MERRYYYTDSLKIFLVLFLAYSSHLCQFLLKENKKIFAKLLTYLREHDIISLLDCAQNYENTDMITQFWQFVKTFLIFRRKKSCNQNIGYRTYYQFLTFSIHLPTAAPKHFSLQGIKKRDRKFGYGICRAIQLKKGFFAVFSLGKRGFFWVFTIQ